MQVASPTSAVSAPLRQTSHFRTSIALRQPAGFLVVLQLWVAGCTSSADGTGQAGTSGSGPASGGAGSSAQAGTVGSGGSSGTPALGGAAGAATGGANAGTTAAGTGGVAGSG